MIITKKKKTLQKSTYLGLPNDLSNRSLLNGLAALKRTSSFNCLGGLAKITMFHASLLLPIGAGSPPTGSLARRQAIELPSSEP